MNATAATLPAQMGHNRPPLEQWLKEMVDTLPVEVRADLADQIARTKDLAANASNVPGEIKNDDEEKIASDILAQMSAHIKVVESRREGIKAPILQAGKIVDNIAKTEGQAPLEREINRINPGMTQYKRVKVERERRQREEQERIAREEAERKRREAEEAERKRREAEAARQRAIEEQRRAEEAAKKAREEAAAAEQRRREAEIRQRAAEAAAAEAETKRKKADAERKARQAQEDAERAERERQEAEARRQREREAAANAKTETALAKAEVSDANKGVKTATSLAKAAETDAHKAGRAVEAKASTLSGQRGDHGGHTSLRTVWVGEIDDKDALLKSAKKLWPFISESDLQKAVNQYVRIHKGDSDLAGVRVFEDSANTIRS